MYIPFIFIGVFALVFTVSQSIELNRVKKILANYVNEDDKALLENGNKPNKKTAYIVIGVHVVVVAVLCFIVFK